MTLDSRPDDHLLREGDPGQSRASLRPNSATTASARQRPGTPVALRLLPGQGRDRSIYVLTWRGGHSPIMMRPAGKPVRSRPVQWEGSWERDVRVVPAAPSGLCQRRPAELQTVDRPEQDADVRGGGRGVRDLDPGHDLAQHLRRPVRQCRELTGEETLRMRQRRLVHLRPRGRAQLLMPPSLRVPRMRDGGREKMPGDGHIAARWRTRKLPGGGQQICPTRS